MKRVAKRKHSAGLGRRAQRGRPHQGCAAPRTSTPRSGSAVRSLRRAAGQTASRVRSTEDEHAAQRQRSPKPATCSGAGRIKGAQHRGLRTPRSGTANPKPATPPQGVERAASRVRSTEDEHAAQRQRSPKPATCSGAGRNDYNINRFPKERDSPSMEETEKILSNFFPALTGPVHRVMLTIVSCT